MNAVHRLSEHEAAIVNKNTGNAMAKHLAKRTRGTLTASNILWLLLLRRI